MNIAKQRRLAAIDEAITSQAASTAYNERVDTDGVFSNELRKF